MDRFLHQVSAKNYGMAVRSGHSDSGAASKSSGDSYKDILSEMMENTEDAPGAASKQLETSSSDTDPWPENLPRIEVAPAPWFIRMSTHPDGSHCCGDEEDESAPAKPEESTDTTPLEEKTTNDTTHVEKPTDISNDTNTNATTHEGYQPWQMASDWKYLSCLESVETKELVHLASGTMVTVVGESSDEYFFEYDDPVHGKCTGATSKANINAFVQHQHPEYVLWESCTTRDTCVFGRYSYPSSFTKQEDELSANQKIFIYGETPDAYEIGYKDENRQPPWRYGWISKDALSPIMTQETDEIQQENEPDTVDTKSDPIEEMKRVLANYIVQPDQELSTEEPPVPTTQEIHETSRNALLNMDITGLLKDIETLFKVGNKETGNDAAALSKELVALVDDFYALYTMEEKRHEASDYPEKLAKLAKDSVAALEKLYKYAGTLSDNGLLQNAQVARSLSVTSNAIGLITEVVSTTDGIDDNKILKTMDAGFGLGKSVYELIKRPPKTLKAMPWTAADLWFALGKMAVGTFLQTKDSIEKYSADGTWNLSDTANTMVDASLRGMFEAAHVLSYGLDEVIYRKIDKTGGSVPFYEQAAEGYRMLANDIADTILGKNI